MVRVPGMYNRPNDLPLDGLPMYNSVDRYPSPAPYQKRPPPRYPYPTQHSPAPVPSPQYSGPVQSHYPPYPAQSPVQTQVLLAHLICQVPRLTLLIQPLLVISFMAIWVVYRLRHLITWLIDQTNK